MPASIDPRTPVLIGTGQVNNRVDRGETPVEPVDLMVEALRKAATDTGRADVLSGADSVRVLMLLSWRYRNPGALVAGRLGLQDPQSIYTVMGGNYVQTVLNRTALDIVEGRNDLVLVTGAESWRSRTDARKTSTDLGWTVQGDDVEPAEPFSPDRDLMGPGEIARGIFMPVQVYPMFENALRAHDGLTLDEQRDRTAQLWSRFSDVAATNPNAWIQRSYSAEEIATVTPDNRMIGFPYTKLENSNNMVEQGAGVIMCSVERAEALGIDRDRWVFLQAGTDASDHWFLSNRDDLHSSPAIRTAGRAALELAGTTTDDLAHVDLYSCFPSAVQIAARELGLGIERPLTVTGGMSFAGGPWNNYAMHGVATMCDVLRRDPGASGLCTANGGYLTKHAMGVYSTEPPTAGVFRWASTQDQVDALPSRELDPEPSGVAEVETYTVMYDRSGEPETGYVAARMADGRRGWGVTTDVDLMKVMTTEELVGRSLHIAPDGAISTR